MNEHNRMGMRQDGFLSRRRQATLALLLRFGGRTARPINPLFTRVDPIRLLCGKLSGDADRPVVAVGRPREDAAQWLLRRT